MGLFGLGYTKEGKGVSKDAAEKKGFFLFFDLFGRKIGKFLKLNMLYFITSIPYLILMFLISTRVMNFNGIITAYAKTHQQMVGLDMLLRLFFLTLLYVFWGAGPLTAGFVYIERNFAREEHAWLLSDFFEKTKESLKYGFMLLILDLIVFSGGMISIRFYMMQSTHSPIFIVPQVILFLLLLIYTMMHTYFYQFLVTFRLNFRELIKNSFLMVMIKFPMNFLLMLTVVAITVLLMYIYPGLLLLLIPFIYVSFTGFILNFYASNMIKRNFIDPYEQKEEAEKVFDEK